MPNRNAVVATIVRFDPPLDRPVAEILRSERGISVELEEGRRVRLDPADPKSEGMARILEGRSRQRLPIYLEVDPATSTITRLFIPYVARVIGLRQIDTAVLSVELDASHARHVLRGTSADAPEIEKRLREALASGDPVILTENDLHEVLDVRAYTPGPEGPPPPFPRFPHPEVPLRVPWRWCLARWWWWIWRWPWWPWRWFHCLSAQKAQQVFDAMSATSCDPLTVPPPCIPFLYPDDGCWGRAHEMCRLMIDIGLSPEKVWIQGYLHVTTANNPNCEVWWGWHVAPTLCVRGPRLFQWQEMVIDPSLFTTPVSKATWKARQDDPNATLTDSDASVFHLWSNTTDPTYASTNQVLATYRLMLQNRALQVGPPPYANCPQ